MNAGLCTPDTDHVGPLNEPWSPAILSPLTPQLLKDLPTIAIQELDDVIRLTSHKSYGRILRRECDHCYLGHCSWDLASTPIPILGDRLQFLGGHLWGPTELSEPY